MSKQIRTPYAVVWMGCWDTMPSHCGGMHRIDAMRFASEQKRGGARWAKAMPQASLQGFLAKRASLDAFRGGPPPCV